MPVPSADTQPAALCKATSASTPELLAAGRAASYKLRSQLMASGRRNPRQCMLAYNVCVRSAFSYGAQVWGPGHLCVEFDRAMQHPMVIEQRRFMQWAAGVVNPTLRLLYMEFSQLPFQVHWASLVLRFWNNLVKHPDTLCHKVFRDDIRLAVHSECGWVHDVWRFLRFVGLEVVVPSDSEAAVAQWSKCVVPIKSVLALYEQRLTVAWRDGSMLGSDPAEYSRGVGPHVCRYAHWMGLPPPMPDGCGFAPFPHASACIPKAQRSALLRFRLLKWDLAVNRPWIVRNRSDRVCKLCKAANFGTFVEDERHVLLECKCYEHLRQRYTHQGLNFTLPMLQIMNSPHTAALAAFLHDVLACRTALFGLMQDDPAAHDPVAALVLAGAILRYQAQHP